MTRDKLTKELRYYATPGNMLCIAGWANSVNPPGEMAGHGIAVYNRQGIHYVFDANDKTGRARVVTEQDLSSTVWQMLFDEQEVEKKDKYEVRINAIYQKELSHTTLPGFFAKSSQVSNDAIAAQTLLSLKFA